MEPRDRVRGWRGRSSKAFVWLRFKQTRMEISDCGDPLHNRACQLMRLVRREGWVNHLVFRALGVENGQEELTISFLTFGELEGSKDLSKRWRCGLRWDQCQTDRDRERAG